MLVEFLKANIFLMEHYDCVMFLSTRLSWLWSFHFCRYDLVVYRIMGIVGRAGISVHQSGSGRRRSCIDYCQNVATDSQQQFHW
jgi:hypothetical protein